MKFMSEYGFLRFTRSMLAIAKVQFSVGRVKWETIRSQSAFQGFHTEWSQL